MVRGGGGGLVFLAPLTKGLLTL